MFLTARILIALVSSAQARSVCADLKPKQELDEGPMKIVNAAIQAGQIATGTTLKTKTQSSDAVSLLQEDDLAKAWFLYQICTLKEAGLISQAKAEELVEGVLLGGATEEQEVVEPEPEAVATASAPAPAKARAPTAAERPQRPLGSGGGTGAARAGAEPTGLRFDRRSFSSQNPTLPNAGSWLQRSRDIAGCIVPGGSSVKVTVVVADDGTAAVSGADAAECLQPIVTQLGWTEAGSYEVSLPVAAPAAP